MFLGSNLSSPTWVERALLEVSILPAGYSYRPEASGEREKRTRQGAGGKSFHQQGQVAHLLRWTFWPNTKAVRASPLPSTCRGDRIRLQAALNKDESTCHTLCTMDLMREGNKEAGRGRQKFQKVYMVGHGGGS